MVDSITFNPTGSETTKKYYIVGFSMASESMCEDKDQKPDQIAP